ncbi:MAG: hypothetical protein WD016_04845 [Balneolaceae bacterium]
MNYHQTLGLLAVLVFFSSAACGLLSGEQDNSGEYPTLYPRFDITEVEKMTSQYQSENGGHLCSTLNEFGFTGYSEILFTEGESPCLSRDVVRIEIPEQDTLIQAAKKILIKNSSYTGVEDTSALQVKEKMPLYGCTICDGPDVDNVPIEWKITFAEQEMDSVQIKNTEITIFIDAKGVNRIWGNWYLNFTQPEFINYGYVQVQNGLTGWKIDMRNFTGEESIYTVLERDLKQNPFLSYLPLENETGLEIRKCWVVPIEYSDGEFPGWFAYVDVMNGEVLKFNSQEVFNKF